MGRDFGFPINPLELKIEITHACNLYCSFCYLEATDLWRNEFHMPDVEVLRWIDWAVSNKIPAIRFTGGEAILHPDIQMLCYYAHLHKRWIILNTNAMAEEALYDELFINDLRISVPNLDPDRLDAMTGGVDVLKKKIALIDRFLAKGTVRVHMLTVLTPELIGKLGEFVKLLQDKPGLVWFPLRYESTPNNPKPLSRSHMQALAEEMADLMERYPDHAKGIFLATPFCSVNPTSLGARVFHGRTSHCGPHAALNVNFKGRLTACFDIGEMFMNGTLEDVKINPTLHSCCSLNALPQECRTCPHVQRCAGGCRKPSCLVNHNNRYIDYLADFIAE